MGSALSLQGLKRALAGWLSVSFWPAHSSVCPGLAVAAMALIDQLSIVSLVFISALDIHSFMSITEINNYSVQNWIFMTTKMMVLRVLIES